MDSMNPAGVQGLENIKVRLATPIGSPSYAVNNFVVPVPASLDKDGEFTLQNVSPGQYRIVLAGIPQGYFIKKEDYGGVDVLNQPLRFDSSQSAKLEIVISPNSGQLTGVSLDGKGLPAAGIQTVLIPDHGRDRIELYKTAITDEAGRFSITAIPPGDYKIFAWEYIEPNFWFDPDVVRSSEAKAHAIHIGELSKESIEVRTIPIAP
jgi:hypothetical protein